MTIHRKLLSFVVLALAPSACLGYGGFARPTPPHILIERSDLIVVAKVVSVSKAVEDEITISAGSKPLKGYYRTYTVQISKSLYINLGKDVKVPKTIEVIMAASKPGKGVQGLREIPLVEDRTYCLDLKKLPDKNSFYYQMDYYFLPDKVAQIKKLADTKKWAWVDKSRLQLAAVQLKQKFTAFDGKAYVHVMAAVRNTSDKSITLDLSPRLKALSIVLMNDTGGVAKADDLYKDVKKLPDDKRNLYNLAPGKIVFLGPAGLARNGLWGEVKKAEGQWKLYLAFTTNRSGAGKGGAEGLWFGQLRSAGFEIEIENSPE